MGEFHDKYTKHPERTSAMTRDLAGILVCAMIVFASISLGFVQVLVKVLLGVEATFDASWSANLSSMASMALGALIQQKIGPAPAAIKPPDGVNVSVPYDAGNASTTSVTTSPAPVASAETCPCCGQPLPQGVTPRDPGPQAFPQQ